MSALHRLPAAIAAFLLLGSLAAAQDTVVARVNGKVITEADMRLAEAEIGSEPDVDSLAPAAKRRVLVEFLIENQLFADAAEGQQLAAGPGFGDRMQYWRRRSLRDVFFEKSISNALSDAEARKIYDRQLATLKPEEEIRARHILVESKEKARELFEKIAYGSDFADLARQYSKDTQSKAEGGDLGYFARGRMLPEFEAAVFDLKPGEVAQPFQTKFGWHIARVDDRRAGRAPSFDAVKERIRAGMIHQKASEIVTDLRARSQIEYVDPEIKNSVDSERTLQKR